MQYKIIIAQNQLSNYENYPFREHITQYIAFYKILLFHINIFFVILHRKIK